MNDQYYMKIAYKEAKKAKNKNEIPVGTVIVRNNKIISKAHNKRDEKNIVTNHAEILAIEKANKKIKNWRLNDCILYTTLEPCEMCNGAIKAAKISKVVYAAKSQSMSNKDVEKIQIEDNVLISECEKIIKELFKQIRNVK